MNEKKTQIKMKKGRAGGKDWGRGENDGGRGEGREKSGTTTETVERRTFVSMCLRPPGGFKLSLV